MKEDKDRKPTQEKEHIIKTVRGFLYFIFDFNKKKGVRNIFYRGHSDKTYDLEPSIYRKDKKTNKLLYIENEDKIYRETIAKVPYDFNGKNTIESLVLMQHYGVPTRILDLTTNPLVALYFACIENKDKDGEVIVFDIPSENVCYFDSDKITILANLAKCGSDFNYPNNESILTLNMIFEDEDYRKISSYDDLLLFLTDKFENNSIVNCSIPKEIKDHIEAQRNSKDITIFLEELPLWVHFFYPLSNLTNLINEKHFDRLLHFIREDKFDFKPIIATEDISKVLAIKPKLDNPRIIRQYGVFLIFGARENNKEMPEVESYWIIAGKNSSLYKRIIIDHKSKENILKELDKLGINKSTLFPEIDKVADYIKEKYTQK